MARDNSIGKWNPAWGPEPSKIPPEERTVAPPKGRKAQDRWHRVTCWSCETKPSFLVYGAEMLAETYSCSRCGMPMSIAVCSKREIAEAIPTRKKSQHGSNG